MAKVKTKINVPFTLHAPHSVFNVNLADKNQFEFNKEIFNTQVDKYAEELDVQYVVVHPGKLGNIEETVRQLNIINPKRMAIENKPIISRKTMERTYRGAIPEEIKYVRENHPCGFCLDISHCMSTANELGKDPYELLKEFQELKPTSYHISGNKLDSLIDLHIHFSKCDWDLHKVFEIIDTSKNITVETRKDKEACFKEYEEDLKTLKEVS